MNTDQPRPGIESTDYADYTDEFGFTTTTQRESGIMDSNLSADYADFTDSVRASEAILQAPAVLQTK